MITSRSKEAMIAAMEAAGDAWIAATDAEIHAPLLATCCDIAEALQRLTAETLREHGLSPVPEMIDLAGLLVSVSLARRLGLQELERRKRATAARNPTS